MKSTLHKVLGLGSWLVTALASINVGLMPFGYDVFASHFLTVSHPGLNMPLHYVVGVAGVICLVMLILTVSGHCCCGSSDCAQCSTNHDRHHHAKQ